MSTVSAAFFSWVQSVPVYADLHAQAVALLPEGHRKDWLDVGCGPGLVARLAAARSYRVRGIDRDPAMIRQARRKSPAGIDCRFEIGDLAQLDAMADVVSAASLLPVLPDPAWGLERLWRCVRPGGHLLLVDTTARMSLANVMQMRRQRPAYRHPIIALWAGVRRGKAIEIRLYDRLPAVTTEVIPLCDGLVAARLFHKPV